jgi:hypothetical protein
MAGCLEHGNEPSGSIKVRNFLTTDSGSHPASYLMGTRGSFPVGKAAWA